MGDQQSGGRILSSNLDRTSISRAQQEKINPVSLAVEFAYATLNPPFDSDTRG